MKFIAVYLKGVANIAAAATDTAAINVPVVINVAIVGSRVAVAIVVTAIIT